MSGTSSADPGKLDEYVLGQQAWVDEMRIRIQAFVDEVDLYSSSSAVSPKINPDLAANLQDHIERWAHLGKFVADVSRGFHELIAQRYDTPHGPGPIGPVFTFNDDSIGRAGQVGYADREEAIRAGRDAAERLQEAIDNRATQEELAAIIDDVAQGQYDPAFAVELSNRLGVEGYAETVGRLNYLYLYGLEGDDPNYDENRTAALAAVDVLGTALTTAMHSQQPRLNEQFRHDLVEEDLGGDEEEHLSVLLSRTSPPTDLALAIADSRLSPLIANGEDPLTHDWVTGMATNYAEMLSHDPDASALWLDHETGGTSNLEHALRMDSWDFVTRNETDRGLAIAEVVENGLTNDSIGLIRPDPVELRTLGERLMDRTIEIVADMGHEEWDEGKDHLYDALATGVDQHMGLIDERINEGRDVGVSGDATDPGTETFEFFKAIAHDEEALARVEASTEEYLIDQIRDPSFPPRDTTPGDGMDPRSERLRQIGAVQGTILAAEGEVLIDSAQDYIEVQQQMANTVNFGVGLVPYLAEGGSTAETVLGAIGNSNDLGEILGDSAGDAVFPSDLDDLRDAFNEQHAREAAMLTDAAVLVAIADNPGHGFPPVSGMTDTEREEFLQWVIHNFDPNDQAHLYLGMSNTVDSFLGQE